MVIQVSEKFTWFQICRKIRITDVDSRNRVENLYRCMQVFNQGFRNWMKASVPPTIFGLSFGFILTMYVTVRDKELPTLAYCCFPVAGAFFMGIIFWVVYDAVVAKRASEEILGNLQSSTPRYMQRLDPVQRMELLRRAKAFRPAFFPNGDFGELTFELPVTVWEESVEQLLLLNIVESVSISNNFMVSSFPALHCLSDYIM